MVGLEDKRTNNDNAFNPTKLSSPLQLSNVSSHNASPLEWLRGRLKNVGEERLRDKPKKSEGGYLVGPQSGICRTNCSTRVQV